MLDKACYYSSHPLFDHTCVILMTVLVCLAPFYRGEAEAQRLARGLIAKRLSSPEPGPLMFTVLLRHQAAAGSAIFALHLKLFSEGPEDDPGPLPSALTSNTSVSFLRLCPGTRGVLRCRGGREMNRAPPQLSLGHV